MVIDLRRVSKNDFLSKTAILSKNYFDKSGLSLIRLIRSSKKVEGDQDNVFGGINYGGEVGKDQFNGIGIGNFARKVGRNQLNGVGLGNFAGEVGEDQDNVFGVVNFAGEVRGYQEGAIFCIQTKNKKSNQKRCLIRYNPLEKIGFGSSVWSKIEKTEKYLDKIKQKPKTRYKSILNSFVREKPTLRKRLTGHNTRADILSRQTKRRLKRLKTLETKV